ncbi:MAG: molybdopterin molybdotransferase MoeA [Oscillospiraceae bacterium]|nr:molybdopterin molybdotransferase MoeA [Oscillospiraceae bacterium]
MTEGKKKLRISREDALAALFALAAPEETETVPPEESCGRVLAEDLISTEAVPPFSKSPLDGFALRGEDTSEAGTENPVVLRITEEIAAGQTPQKPVLKGQTAKILTGAPIPEGANAVVRFEETDFTEETVTITNPINPNTNIVPAGDDLQPGQRFARRGEVVTPPVAGMMAAAGMETVRVFRKPRVTVISTGRELTGPGEPLACGMIRNSSYALLKGYMEQAGAEVGTLGIVGDDPDVIAEAMQRALASSDMVVTTGGVSVGDYDYVLAASEKIGARRLFWKVRFRPGGTMLAAEKDGKVILGFSGNPASASLGLHIIGLPFLRALCGQEKRSPVRVKARLLTPIEKDSPYGRLVRGRMELEDGEVRFRCMDHQGNGALTSLLGCDMIADIPPHTPPLPEGAVIDAYIL